MTTTVEDFALISERMRQLREERDAALSGTAVKPQKKLSATGQVGDHCDFCKADPALVCTVSCWTTMMESSEKPE
jgi:hypothetical protein